MGPGAWLRRAMRRTRVNLHHRGVTIAAGIGYVPAVPSRPTRAVPPQTIDVLVDLRRARDLMDREYASPLDVPAMAERALMSPAHFSREFKRAYGETPHTYLLTRRIERAMHLLRAGVSVTDTCMQVGWTSLGSFSARFSEVVGESPTAYRARPHTPDEALPACIARIVLRPPRTPRPPMVSSFEEADGSRDP